MQGFFAGVLFGKMTQKQDKNSNRQFITVFNKRVEVWKLIDDQETIQFLILK